MGNKKAEILWSGIFISLLCIGLLFYMATEEKKEKFSALWAENEAAEIFAAHAGERKELKIFSKGEDALREALSAVGESGIWVTDVSEERPEETEHGKILKMKIKGRGSFAQVLSLFDIIHMEKHWVAAELRKAEMKDGSLRFEMELTAYQGKSAVRGK